MTVSEPTPPTTARPAQSGDVVVSVRGLTKVFKDFWGRSKARAVDDVEDEVLEVERAREERLGARV